MRRTDPFPPIATSLPSGETSSARTHPASASGTVQCGSCGSVFEYVQQLTRPHESAEISRSSCPVNPRH